MFGNRYVINEQQDMLKLPKEAFFENRFEWNSLPNEWFNNKGKKKENITGNN
jgi:hypothetical protein